MLDTEPVPGRAGAADGEVAGVAGHGWGRPYC